MLKHCNTHSLGQHILTECTNMQTFFFQFSTAKNESLSTVENATTQTWAPVSGERRGRERAPDLKNVFRAHTVVPAKFWGLHHLDTHCKKRHKPGLLSLVRETQLNDDSKSTWANKPCESQQKFYANRSFMPWHDASCCFRTTLLKNCVQPQS